MKRITVMKLLTGSIVLPFETDPEAAIERARRAVARACPGIADALTYRIYRRSTDARRRDMIRFVYTVSAEASEPFECDTDALAAEGIRICADREPIFKHGTLPSGGRPLVVGSGPAGMFCALVLAENGYKPLLIERGAPLSERVAAVDRFFGGGELDPETNVLFGAGGAGTFSDGKLVTRVNDPYVYYVLRRLNGFGAPDEILSSAKPHVGTDILRRVVGTLLDRVVALGGEIKYNCCLRSLDDGAQGYVTTRTTDGDIVAGAVVLATGHSARDTSTYLYRNGYAVEAKPFSVGVRIEHLTEDIDRAMYGSYAGDPRLGHAEYTLSDTSERGVYTFCMCPGGVVIAAAGETGGVVVNGMSYHARDGRNSNCALAVSVEPSDYGATPEAAIEFQRNIEKAAYAAGGGNYTAPAETVGDFLAGKTHGFASPTTVTPTYTRGNVAMCDLSGLFPAFVSQGLERGLSVFGKRIAGFDSPSALMTGVETRTSSPVRILRDLNCRAIGHPLIYPCGEGAGYAGGISSAATDGIRVAESIMATFAPYCGT